MAKVEVDLSEYDMLRDAKKKAEEEVVKLTKEIEDIKNTASNVVVKTRYYIPSLDFNAAASRIVHNLGNARIEGLLYEARRLGDARSYMSSFEINRTYNAGVFQEFANLIQASLKDMLNLRASYVEDCMTTEVRGFDEMRESIKAKIEEEYKSSFEQKNQELDAEIKAYDAKKLIVDEAVDKAVEKLKHDYELKIEKLKADIENLEKEKTKVEEALREASKTSEQKLAEALEKLKAAQAEVEKYSNTRKGLFRFRL